MKRQSLTVTAIAAALALAGISGCATPGESGFTAQHRSALEAAIAAGTRTPANVARDRYRNPGPTLAFFGVRPSDTVVEIWPGGGWYTEILAPYLRQGGGTYYAVANGQGLARVNEWRTAKPELYGAIQTAAFPAWEAGDTRVPDGSADVVLTFRNVHNFRMGYQRPDKQDYTLEAFRQAHRMLKPGGVLGVVDHRLPENADAERERSSGYIKQSTVSASPSEPASGSPPPARSTPTRATRPIGRMACGRSRPRCGSATRTARAIWRSARATA
jgi:predicted methyltransferase